MLFLSHTALRLSTKSGELQHTRVWEDADTVLNELGGILGVSVDEFRRKRRDGTLRGIAALALIRRCGLSQREAAGVLGVGSGSAVSYLTRDVKTREDKHTRDALRKAQLT